MAIKLIDNQPIVALRSCIHFDCPESNLDQLITPDDQQLIQLLLSPRVIGAVLDPTAFSLTGGFVALSSELQCTGAGTASISAGLAANKRYQIDFVISSTSAEPGEGYRVSLNGTYLKVEGTNPLFPSNYAQLSGVQQTYLSVTTVGTDILSFEVSAGVTDMRFDQITISELPKLFMNCLDKGKGLLAVRGDSCTSYITDSNRANVQIIWNTMPFETKYLSFFDPDEFDPTLKLLLNSSFDSDLSGWSASGFSYDATNHRAEYPASPPTGGGLVQFITVIGEFYYNLQVEVGATGIQLLIFIDSDPPIYHTLLGGHNSIPIDLCNRSGSISLGVYFYPLDNSIPTWVDDVFLRAVCRPYNISIPFDMRYKHASTLFIRGVNRKNAFEFVFDNFGFNIRVHAKLSYADYTDTSSVFGDSGEQQLLLRANPIKLYQLTIFGQPEYIHNALALVRLFDRFFIDEERMFPAGNYEVDKVEDVIKQGAKATLKKSFGLEPNTFI